MRLWSIQLLRQHAGTHDPQTLARAYDLSSLGYFQRSPAREMITFAARTIIKRTERGHRVTIEHEGYYCHVYVRRDGHAAITVADQEYPSRVAFTLMNNLLDTYDRDPPVSTQKWPPLDKAMVEYQDPTQIDQILAIQKELDETKEVLQQTIENVLARDEKLEELVAKSKDLSVQSRVFYSQARGTNACCVIM